MPTPRLTDQEPMKRVGVLRTHGNEYPVAAKSIDKPDTFIRHTVLEAGRSGLLDARGPSCAVRHSYQAQDDPDRHQGNETGRSTVIGPAIGLEFRMPKGYALGDDRRDQCRR